MNQQAPTRWRSSSSASAAIDAFARVGGHLDGAQAQTFERLQRGGEGGRLHHHHVARPGDGLQAQVERFHRAIGDHPVLRPAPRPLQRMASPQHLAQTRLTGDARW